MTAEDGTHTESLKGHYGHMAHRAASSTKEAEKEERGRSAALGKDKKTSHYHVNEEKLNIMRRRYK